MTWNSVQHLVEDFGLEADPYDLHAIRRELKSRLAQLHPDRTGGEFPSEAHEREYHRYSKALEYIESQERMLVPVSAATELVRQVTQSITRATREPLEERILRVRADHQATISQGFRVPKISLGVISAVLAYVFLFPQHIQNHPYLSALLNFSPLLPLWAMAVTVLLWLWLLTWMVERQLKAKVERLFSLACHRAVLESAKWETNGQFSRSELEEFLERSPDPRKPRPFFLSPLFSGLTRIDPKVIEQATDLAIERYLERGWIRSLDREEIEDFGEFGIDDWFETTF